MGAISFSLYLLHDILFRFVFYFLRTRGLTDLPGIDYWLIIVLSALVTTLLCAATYRWIEFPFLSISHRKPATEKSLAEPAKNKSGELLPV